MEAWDKINQALFAFNRESTLYNAKNLLTLYAQGGFGQYFSDRDWSDLHGPVWLVLNELATLAPQTVIEYADMTDEQKHIVDASNEPPAGTIPTYRELLSEWMQRKWVKPNAAPQTGIDMEATRGLREEMLKVAKELDAIDAQSQADMVMVRRDDLWQLMNSLSGHESRDLWDKMWDILEQTSSEEPSE